MWICDNEGFLSIVSNWNDDDTLLVRARSEKHLKNLFPYCEMFTDAEADYPFRAYINRDEVAEVIAMRLAEAEYTNFKDSVKDDDLHDAYVNIWQVMWSAFYDERREVQ